MMSRKDYVAVAAIIERQVSVAKTLSPTGAGHSLETTKAIAEDLASLFQADNPRFDRQRFLGACGL